MSHQPSLRGVGRKQHKTILTKKKTGPLSGFRFKGIAPTEVEEEKRIVPPGQRNILIDRERSRERSRARTRLLSGEEDETSDDERSILLAPRNKVSRLRRFG